MKIYKTILLVLLCVYSNIAQSHQAVSYNNDLPFIFCVAQPKSGSEHLLATLRFGLNIRNGGWAEAGAYPYFLLDPNALVRLLNDSHIYKTHLAALPPNINLLNKYVTKLVLHVRDPRQTVLSWAHYANKLRSQSLTKDSIHLFHPFHPVDSGYFEWDLNTQVNWCIENYYPVAIRWLEGWGQIIKNIDNYNFDLLVVTHNAFLTDREQYLQTILDFYGIHNSDFTDPMILIREKIKQKCEINPHCNPAIRHLDPTNEWKTDLTAKQIARLAELTPKSLLQQFGWEAYPPPEK